MDSFKLKLILLLPESWLGQAGNSGDKNLDLLLTFFLTLLDWMIFNLPFRDKDYDLTVSIYLCVSGRNTNY